MVENENGRKWMWKWKLPPEARRRRRLTTKWSDSKSLYLAIDASWGANSFWKAETLSFSKWCFLLNFDLRKASKGQFRNDTSNQRLRRNTAPSAEIYAFGGICAFGEIQNSLRICRKFRPAQSFGFFWVYLGFSGFILVFLGFLRFQFS